MTLHMNTFNMTTANSPTDNSSKDCRTSKIEVDVDIAVKIFVFKLGLYLPAFLAAIITQAMIFVI